MAYDTKSVTIASEGILSAPSSGTYVLPVTATSDMSKDYEIEIVRRNTFALSLTVSDSEGTVVDLSGYSMKMTVKRNSEDTDANAIIGPVTATISSPTTGVGAIALTSAQTNIPSGEYFYDVKIENAGVTDRHTVLGPSKFTVIEDVTKG